FLPVTWQPKTIFTIASWLEDGAKDGKYKDAMQPVFQTYRLQLSQFQAENPQFDPGSLSEITFFLSGSQGKIMLDDIGVDKPVFAS
ncbi:alpha/beta hydrolase, partial [Paenibacillus sepulcri]|nr:alpha/beta hydrolase [Paenibacillus sepulcri]